MNVAVEVMGYNAATGDIEERSDKAIGHVFVFAIIATFCLLLARRDSAEDFSRLSALPCTTMDWIFIPVHCFALP